MKTMSKAHFKIFSDGGSFNNGYKNPDLPQFSTSGIVITLNENVLFEGSKGHEGDHATISYAELYGAILACKVLEKKLSVVNGISKPYRVTLYSDSQYVVKGAMEWMPGWKKRVWKNADKCVIIHTHGSATGLFDQDSNNTPKIISTSEIKKIPKNNSIYFVMMTACSTAVGDKKSNVAYYLSKKINSKGIIIANKYTVSGGSTKFKAKDGSKGWVAYKNGKIVRDSDNIPAELTMEKAYKIYEELT